MADLKVRLSSDLFFRMKRKIDRLEYENQHLRKVLERIMAIDNCTLYNVKRIAEEGVKESDMIRKGEM